MGQGIITFVAMALLIASGLGPRRTPGRVEVMKSRLKGKKQ